MPNADRDPGWGPGISSGAGWGSPHGLHPSDRSATGRDLAASPGTSPRTDYQVSEEKAQFLTPPVSPRRKRDGEGVSGQETGASLSCPGHLGVLGAVISPSAGWLPCALTACIQPHSLIFGRCSRCRRGHPLEACSAWRARRLWICTPWYQAYGEGGASGWNPACQPQGCCASLPGPESAASEGGEA